MEGFIREKLGELWQGTKDDINAWNNTTSSPVENLLKLEVGRRTFLGAMLVAFGSRFLPKFNPVLEPKADLLGNSYISDWPNPDLLIPDKDLQPFAKEFADKSKIENMAVLNATAEELGVSPEALRAAKKVQGRVSSVHGRGEATIYRDSNGNAAIAMVKHTIAGADHNPDRGATFSFPGIGVVTNPTQSSQFFPVGASNEQFDAVWGMGLSQEGYTSRSMSAETRDNLPRLATGEEVAACFRGELKIFSIDGGSVTIKDISGFQTNEIYINDTPYQVGNNFMMVNGAETSGNSGEALYAVSGGQIIFIGVVSHFIAEVIRDGQPASTDMALYALVANR
jgi:hypothetical protein